MSSIVNELRGVLLPLQNAVLLLPNLAMAEVVGYRDAESVTNAPEWLNGFIVWNQKKIPLIAFESLVGDQTAKPGHRARIALCYNPDEFSDIPLLGLLCKSIPHLARLDEQTLRDDKETTDLPDMVLRHVYYDGKDAWIPDLEKLAEASSVFL